MKEFCQNAYLKSNQEFRSKNQGIWGLEDHGKTVHKETVRQKHEMAPPISHLV